MPKLIFNSLPPKSAPPAPTYPDSDSDSSLEFVVETISRVRAPKRARESSSSEEEPQNTSSDSESSFSPRRVRAYIAPASIPSISQETASTFIISQSSESQPPEAPITPPDLPEPSHSANQATSVYRRTTLNSSKRPRES